MASFSSESVDSRPDLEFRGRATWKALLFFLPHEAIVAAVRAGSGTLGIWFGQAGANTQKESPKWSKNGPWFPWFFPGSMLGRNTFDFCIATILRGASHLPRLTQGESRTHGIRLNIQNHGFWSVKKNELVGGTPTNDQPTWDLPESCFRPKLLHEPWFESFLVLRHWSWSH